MRKKMRLVLAGLVLAAVAVPTVASADTQQSTIAGGDPISRYCEHKLDEAARLDMESFRDFDAQTFRDGHDPRAITVFPSGVVAVGIDEIMRLLGPHFTNRNAVWTWNELGRIVEPCKTAVIYYDARYEIPSLDFKQHQLVVVTWIFKDGTWLAVSDSNTLLP